MIILFCLFTHHPRIRLYTARSIACKYSIMMLADNYKIIIKTMMMIIKRKKLFIYYPVCLTLFFLPARRASGGAGG